MLFTDYYKYCIEGLSLGFAAGASCAVYCIPVLIGLASRNVNHITPVSDFTFFLLGRLVAYCAISILFSLLGMTLPFLSYFDTISKLFLAILLIAWGILGFKSSNTDKSHCTLKKFVKGVPLFAGILTGLNPCPPFIAGITRVTTIGDVWAGILYFFCFYISTTIFLIPSLSTGFLKYRNELKVIASFVSIIFGCVFLYLFLFSKGEYI